MNKKSKDTLKIPSPPMNCNGQLYTVRKGDTLAKISNNFGIPLNQVIVANPQVTNPNVLFENQKICIPGKFIPKPPVDKLRRVILRGTDAAPKAIGFANVRLEPARVTIVGFDLPEPTTFGPEFTRYRGWVVDTETLSRFRIDMEMIFPGVWAGDESNGSLINFDEIFVTPEPIPGATFPIGPRVLFGTLAECI